MWIKIKDRLPNDGQLVLIYDRDGAYFLAEFDSDWGCFVDDYGTHFDNSCNYEITHWMPLPEHPILGDQLKEPARKEKPGKCVDCPYWANPTRGHCMRGDGDEFCVKGKD